MGKYTVNDNPLIDQVIQSHMQRIVAEITSRIKPDSIILRGSFGRGEGSVMVRNGSLHFLSDYEIDVTATSPFHRSLFSKLTQELSNEFGMQAGIRWMRPDCLTRDRIGPFPIGRAKTTISLYEFRYGSQILWGRDLFSLSPPINPDQINLMSGLMLLLNRMAESLFFMTLDDDYIDSECITYYWINKTILACAETLLLVWKQYHYSYRERGNRFLKLSQAKLNIFQENAALMKNMVMKATEFKLQPKSEYYPSSVKDTWLQVLPLCEATLRYMVENIMNRKWNGLSSYPEIYLDYAAEKPKDNSGKLSFLVNLHQTYKALHANRLPKIFTNKHRPYDIVYSAVPLLFLSYGPQKSRGILQTGRDLISKLCTLKPPSPDLDKEWDYLRQQLADLWKVFCS